MKHLYIHIPFCQRRCSYCDFNTYANMEDRIDAYVAALCSELRAYAAQHPATRAVELLAPLEPLTRASLRPTIFLGGGTPTMLSLPQMERVLAAANEIVPLDQAEVTTEANPGTVIDEAYLRGLRSLGINRISFGVQSLHDPTLRVLGRIHTAAEAIATYEQARRAGFDRVNLDFIFGLPGQTAEQWAWTLDQLAPLDAEHISLYSLILEQGTPLHQQVTRGSITVPDDDATAAMYELAMEKLAAAGFVQYEISNWAKDAKNLEPRTKNLEAKEQTIKRSNEQTGSNLPPRLPHRSGKGSPRRWGRGEGEAGGEGQLPSGACLHNVAYWLNADYIGCGAGAHGHIYPRRWHDILSVDEYIRTSREGRLPIAETLDLSQDDLFSETMMMGLRLNNGVSFAHFADRCGHELRDVYSGEIRQLIDLGLIEQDSIGIRLTERGRMLGNEVFLRFLRDEPSQVTR
ncbi:MAG TPA: radical SAM family heme chaperone HemW [Herpetosiphonaceae bacterium]